VAVLHKRCAPALAASVVRARGARAAASTTPRAVKDATAAFSAAAMQAAETNAPMFAHAILMTEELLKRLPGGPTPGINTIKILGAGPKPHFPPMCTLGRVTSNNGPHGDDFFRRVQSAPRKQD
jgi:hypothetical protein